MYYLYILHVCIIVGIFVCALLLLKILDNASTPPQVTYRTYTIWNIYLSEQRDPIVTAEHPAARLTGGHGRVVRDADSPVTVGQRVVVLAVLVHRYDQLVQLAETLV